MLSPRQREAFESEAALLERLVALLERYPAKEGDLAALREAAGQLRAPFLLVVVGEFNAGKSAFINALLGAQVMPEGVTPTTDAINLLAYGEAAEETALGAGLVRRRFPAPLLRDVTVVDTPGTNAILREHEALTQRFVPRADLVLFITSADRPFTESERGFMADIRQWGKKIVVILNKADLLRDEDGLRQVVDFVRDGIRNLLGFTPEVFPCSSLLAQQARALEGRNPTERDRLWAASRFGGLERYLWSTLDVESRVRLKLLSPLGVAERLAERYLSAARSRLGVLARDAEAITAIERHLAGYRDEQQRQFRYHLARVENVIAKLNVRADSFLDETIRLGRLFDLLNGQRLRAQFEAVVVGDTRAQIDAIVGELVDWMVEQDLKAWQAVTDFVDRRRLARYGDEMVGEVGQFSYDRREVLGAVALRARREMERYNAEALAHQLSESLRTAVAAMAVTEAGALGLGALVVTAASTVAMDVTGILAASLIAGLGLFVLPMRRRQAREDFHRRSEALEQHLAEAMREQFDHELERSLAHIREAVAPYTRFVRGEHDKLNGLQADLQSARDQLGALRRRVEGSQEV